MDVDESNFEIVTDILQLTEEESGVFEVEVVSNEPENNMEDNLSRGMAEIDLQQLQTENFEFIKKQKSASTLRKTEKDVERFILYLETLREPRKPEQIEPRSLDVYISTYMKDLKKQNGGEYEPDSITAIFCSMDRYLRERHYKASLMDSSAFKNSREMIEAKRRSLKALGKGNKPNKSIALTSKEVDILWENGGFGYDNPEQLTATVWFLLSLHFGFRGAHDSRQLKMGDIDRREDANGDTYLEVNERLSKTRVGAGNPRSFNPKAWGTGSPRSPVRIYDAYNMRKPLKMLETGKPFYLAVNHMRRTDSPIWFACAPLGHNSIGSLMKTIGIRANIGRNLTNHVVRKTAITSLVHAGLPYGLIAQHSGHKNVDSIKHYATASLPQQKLMLAILSHKPVNKSILFPE